MSSLYLSRYAHPSKLQAPGASSDLTIIVVIPCFNEPDLLATLHSLNKCQRPEGSFEVIVVINEATNDSTAIKAQNQKTYQQALAFQGNHQLPLHVLYESLEPKHAGVGLARKIGMDDATRRFEHLGKDGILVALDADCTVAANYLIEIERHFAQNPQTPGCSIYYEHPLAGCLDAHLYRGIAGYELHLRYYTHALRYAGHPFAFQTVGSSMAVRSSAYQKQGGMNRRQAGEDFYFLQNIFLLGDFTELYRTCVYPSARISDRVPFGTGKAQQQWSQKQNQQELLSYHHKTFEDLKIMLTHQASMWTLTTNESWALLPTSIQQFIGHKSYKHKLEAIKSQAKDFNSFQKRFFYWCNGVFAFKFAHHCRDHHYPNIPVSEAAGWLLSINYQMEPARRLVELLKQYRDLDLRK